MTNTSILPPLDLSVPETHEALWVRVRDLLRSDRVEDWSDFNDRDWKACAEAWRGHTCHENGCGKAFDEAIDYITTRATVHADADDSLESMANEIDRILIRYSTPPSGIRVVKSPGGSVGVFIGGDPDEMEELARIFGGGSD